MKAFAALAVLALALGSCSSSGRPGSDLSGLWVGRIEAPGLPAIPVAFEVTEDGAGRTALFHSPSQGAFGLAVEGLKAEGDKLEFELPTVGARFSGRFEAKDGAYAGAWIQGGARLALTLSRPEAGTGLARPQTPAEPYPYIVEELSFPGGAPGVTLSGTITRPDTTNAAVCDTPGGLPMAGLVLVSGSGPSDRDESIAGHRPYWVLADLLTKAGFAVLRYDDRGVAKSTGDHASATSFDFADDAAAAVAFLRSRPGMWGLPVGIIGHSEGALIASIIIGRDPKALDFSVFLGGPAWPGHQILMQQNEATLKLHGASPLAVDVAMKLNRKTYDLIMAGGPDDALEASLRELFAQGGLAQRTADAQIAAIMSPWFKTFLALDPADQLRNSALPVLALYGGLDTQVVNPANPDRMREILSTNRNPFTRVVVLEGLNHLLQTARTGAVSEYGLIEETISPEAVTAILKWVAAFATGDSCPL